MTCTSRASSRSPSSTNTSRDAARAEAAGSQMNGATERRSLGRSVERTASRGMEERSVQRDMANQYQALSQLRRVPPRQRNMLAAEATSSCDREAMHRSSLFEAQASARSLRSSSLQMSLETNSASLTEGSPAAARRRLSIPHLRFFVLWC